MNVGTFDGCLVAEEFSYGCTGIGTALEGSGLGVSLFYNVLIIMFFILCIFIIMFLYLLRCFKLF